MGTLPSQWSRLDANGAKRTQAEQRRPKDPNRTVVCFEYEVESYADNVIARYLEVGGLSADKLKTQRLHSLTKQRAKAVLRSNKQLQNT